MSRLASVLSAFAIILGAALLLVSLLDFTPSHSSGPDKDDFGVGMNMPSSSRGLYYETRAKLGAGLGAGLIAAGMLSRSRRGERDEDARVGSAVTAQRRAGGP